MKLVFSHVNIYESNGSTLVGKISNVLVEAREINPEMNTSEVDDGRESIDSYKLTVSMRTKNESFDTGGAGTDAGTAILSVSEIGNTGASTPDDAVIEFVGVSGSKTIKSAATTINGNYNLNEGNFEVELMATLEAIALSDLMTLTTV